jgi:hypothetical protein
MGKLGAKLTVWEQSWIGAGCSVDRRRRHGPNPQKSSYVVARRVDGFSFLLAEAASCGGSVAFVSSPGCSFPRTLLKLPATFPDGRKEGKLPGPTYFAYPARLSIATVSFVRHALLVSVEASRSMEKRVASTSKYSSGILFSSSTQYNNNENYNSCTNSEKIYKNIILKKCKEWFDRM